MLLIHLQQQWYSLSDPAMEEALIEVPTMRRFAGIDLISDRIPDETTILSIRHLLEKQGLGEQIFETVKAHLSNRGVAPSSTKNKAGKRDPEMHQTKKGIQARKKWSTATPATRASPTDLRWQALQRSFGWRCDQADGGFCRIRMRAGWMIWSKPLYFWPGASNSRLSENGNGVSEHLDSASNTTQMMEKKNL
jgi:IS5 family transposase